MSIRDYYIFIVSFCLSSPAHNRVGFISGHIDDIWAPV